MAYILSIETGTDICSVALSDGKQLISLRESEEGWNHAQNLAVFVEEILQENQISAEDLSAVAIGMGPGSYTGLRIGVSLAKGLCYAGGIPLIAVDSLQSMALVAIEDYQAGILDIDHFDTAILCPMIDARRMEVYTRIFDHNGLPLSETMAELVTADSFLPYRETTDQFVVFGNGAAKCKGLLSAGNILFRTIVPSARGMVTLANRKYQENDFVDTAYFEPFYLKDFIAGQPKRDPLKKIR